MNYTNEINNVANWMKDYIAKAGLKGFVVGLSGGIDSAVIACLAVKAVGAENVIGVSIPCQSRDDMNTDAEELAKNLNIRYMTIPIEDSYKCIIGQIGGSTQLTKANVKARLRMVVLYMIANQNNYIVSGTTNLTEAMIGYFTKYGDGGVDIEPVANYYKNEIYKMAELMPEIPENIKTKAPSADLWDGQTDEDEMGIKYSELDFILANLGTREEDSLGEEKADKVKAMIKNAGHKNNLPPRYIRK